MLPIPKPIAIACSCVLLVAAAAGCGGGDATLSTVTTASAPLDTIATGATAPASPPVAPVPTTGSAAVPTSAAAGSAATPVTDPCDWLTPAVAGEALGVPVGDKITQPGQGNTTCAYRPADPAAQGLVSLTLYGVTGSEAVLDAAATQFPDAKSVDGVGDSARVSVQSHAVGVLTGSTVFALGLYPQQADGQLSPITEDQLLAVARAVLAGH